MTDRTDRPFGDSEQQTGHPVFAHANEDASSNHVAECRWQRTTEAECEYRATHNYCPHPEHACDCEAIKRDRMFGEMDPGRARNRAAEHDAGSQRYRTVRGGFKLFGCAKRGCDAVNPDHAAFGARGKSWCLNHVPVLVRLKMRLRRDW